MAKLISRQQKIGVLCGGDSSEREISLRSGQAVLESLGRCGFSVLKIDPKKRSRAQKALAEIDLAFIALHGKGGEDGSIQAHLERRKIPYVGSDPRGSWQAMDKVLSKRIFERVGIPTPPWQTVNQRSWRKLKSFPTPFFLKPVADGSSIGVFLVEDFEQSAEKIIQALESYPRLLAEQKIGGREFTVGILGNQALPVVELRPKGKFYDYHCKYTAGMTEYLVPAPVPEGWVRRFQQVARKVHRALGLRDFSRVDLMADSLGRPYVLEANTIPGFTQLSLLPKAAKEAGISFDELCRRLVEMAWKRRLRAVQRNGKT